MYGALPLLVQAFRDASLSFKLSNLHGAELVAVLFSRSCYQKGSETGGMRSFMRDADDEEKTRLFDAKQGSKSAAFAAGARSLPAAPKRDGGVAPRALPSDPDDEATRLISSDGDDESTRLIDTDTDNEPTKLVQAVGVGEWLLSRGTDPPRSVSRAQLFKEIADGTLSPETYAWKDGMKDWQPLRAIPTLAPLLRGRALPKVPRADIGPVVKKSALAPNPIAVKPKTGSPAGNQSSDEGTPQSRITAVSRSSAAARAAAVTGDHTSAGAKAEHTVTSSSARASQAAKDSTVLVSGSLPPSDSVETSAPLLPATQPPDQPKSVQRTSSAPPRPAAGQPPSPTELIAKAPPLVALPRPHREVTQPARSRLTAVTQLTHLASAAGGQHNLVLWVLGAAGWVVAGVLGGVLFAKSGSEPAAPPAAAAEARPDPHQQTPATTPQPAAPPVVEAAALPTASSALGDAPAKIQRMLPRVGPAASAAPQPGASPSVAKPPQSPLDQAPTGDVLNSPGF